MHELIENKIKDAEKMIEHYKSMEEDLLEVLSVVSASTYNVYIGTDIHISWQAKSMNEAKELLKLFAQKGIMLYTFFKDDTYWCLKGKAVYIYLRPVWTTEEGVEGVTCRKVQVDTKFVSIPIYKVFCNGKEVGQDEMNS
jgi:hypothetical protein